MFVSKIIKIGFALTNLLQKRLGSVLSKK